MRKPLIGRSAPSSCAAVWRHAIVLLIAVAVPAGVAMLLRGEYRLSQESDPVSIRPIASTWIGLSVTGWGVAGDYVESMWLMLQ